MSKSQMVKSFLSPKAGKTPTPQPSQDRSKVFKFSEPKKPAGSSVLQELSVEISDIYEFRQKCFDKVKSLESVIERNRVTYENEINYMQEFIKILKRKLAKATGSGESIDMTCDDCKEKLAVINSLTAEAQQLENSARTFESQTRVLKGEVIRQKKELETAYTQISQGQEFVEIVAELEKAKQADDKLIFELKTQNKRLEIQMKDSEENLMRALAELKKVSEVKEIFKENTQNLIGKWEKESETFFKNSAGIEQKLEDFQEELEKAKKNRKKLENEVRSCEDVLKEAVSQFSEIGNKTLREMIEEVLRDFKKIELEKSSFVHQLKELADIEEYQKKQIGLLERTVEGLEKKFKVSDESMNILKNKCEVLESDKVESARLQVGLLDDLKKSQFDSKELSLINKEIEEKLTSSEFELAETKEKALELNQWFLEATEKLKQQNIELEGLKRFLGKISQDPENETQEELDSYLRNPESLEELSLNESPLKYLDVIQNLLQSLRANLKENEEIKQKNSENELKIEDLGSEQKILLQEQEKNLAQIEALQSDLKDKKKLKELLDEKNRELAKLQEVMERFLSNKEEPSAKEPKSPSKLEEGQSRYSAVIKDLSFKLKEKTSENEELKKDKHQLQVYVSQLLNEINGKFSQDIIDGSSSRSGQSEESKNKYEEQEESENEDSDSSRVSLEEVEDEQLFCDLQKEQDSAEKHGNSEVKCISILSPTEPLIEKTEGASVVFNQKPSSSSEAKGIAVSPSGTSENLNTQLSEITKELQLLKDQNVELSFIKKAAEKILKELGPEEERKDSPLEEKFQDLAQKLKKNQILENEVQKLLQEKRTFEDQLIDLNSIQEKISQELRSAKEINSLLENELKALQNDLQRSEDQLMERSQIQSELSQRNEMLKELIAEKVFLEEKVEELKDFVKRASEELKAAGDERQITEARVQELELVQENLIEELKNKREELVYYKGVEGEKEKLAEEKLEISRVLDKAETRNLSLLGQAEKIVSDYSQLLESNKALERELGKAAEDVRALKGCLRDYEKAELVNQQLERENRSLQDSISKIAGDIRGQNELKNELLTVLAEKRVVEAANKELEELVRKGKNDLAQMKEYEKAVSDQQCENEKLKQDILELDSQVINLTKLNEALEWKLKESQESCESLANDCKKIPEYEKSIKQAENSQKELQEQLEKQIKKIEKLQKKISDKEEDLKEKDLLNSGLAQDLLNEKSDAKKLKDLCSGLENQLSLLEQEKSDLLQEKKEKELNIIDLANSLKKLDKEKSEIQFILKTEQIKNKELSENLAELKETLKNEQESNSQLSKDFQEKSKENQMKQDALETLSAAQRSLEQEKSEHLNELKELAGRNTEKNKELEKLDSLNKALKEQLKTVSEKLEKSLKTNQHLVDNSIKLHSLNEESQIQISELLPSLESEKSKVSLLSSQNANLLESLQDLRSRVASLSQENEHLYRELNEKKQLEAALQGLISTNSAAEQKIEEQEMKIREILYENERLKDRVTTLSLQNQDLEKTEGELIEEISRLVKKEDQTDKALRQVQEKLKKDEQEKERLQSQVGDLWLLKEKVIEYEQVNCELKESENALIEKLEKNQENYNRLLEDYEVQALEKEALLGDNETLHDKTGELIAKLDSQPDFSGVLHSIAGVNKKLENEKLEIQGKLERLNEENLALRNELQKLSSESQKMQEENLKLARVLEGASDLRKSREGFQESSGENKEKLIEIVQKLLNKNEGLFRTNEELGKQLEAVLEDQRKINESLKDFYFTLEDPEGKGISEDLPVEIESLLKSVKSEAESLKEQISALEKYKGKYKSLKKNKTKPVSSEEESKSTSAKPLHGEIDEIFLTSAQPELPKAGLAALPSQFRNREEDREEGLRWSKDPNRGLEKIDQGREAGKTGFERRGDYADRDLWERQRGDSERQASYEMPGEFGRKSQDKEHEGMRNYGQRLSDWAGSEDRGALNRLYSSYEYPLDSPGFAKPHFSETHESLPRFLGKAHRGPEFNNRLEVSKEFQVNIEPGYRGKNEILLEERLKNLKKNKLESGKDDKDDKEQDSLSLSLNIEPFIPQNDSLLESKEKKGQNSANPAHGTIFENPELQEETKRLLHENTVLSNSLKETIEKVESQQDRIEDLIQKLKDQEDASNKESDLSELLSKIKYQTDLITELENKNLELEGRFNRIRNKNNLLESNTKKYSENVEKVFKDVNKKIIVLEKSLANKEEKLKALYNDYSKFKQKYITGFQEKSKALLDSIKEVKGIDCENLDKDDLIKLLKNRIEFLQEKIDALVKANYITKEIIENISDKAHDAIEMIKVD